MKEIILIIVVLISVVLIGIFQIKIRKNSLIIIDNYSRRRKLNKFRRAFLIYISLFFPIVGWYLTRKLK